MNDEAIKNEVIEAINSLTADELRELLTRWNEYKKNRGANNE